MREKKRKNKVCSILLNNLQETQLISLFHSSQSSILLEMTKKWNDIFLKSHSHMKKYYVHLQISK
jgi:hypothetical protein